MIEKVKNMIEGEDGETIRADGGSADTARDTPESQQQGEQSDRDDARTEPKQDDPTDLPIELDQVFEILKNQRRRHVLRYLTTTEDEVRLGELAEQIAAWENDKEVRLITSQERKRVYVGLYQGHLPKMDDVGAISYNKPRGKIDRGENIDFFQRYLPENTDAPETPRTLRAALRTAVPFLDEN